MSDKKYDNERKVSLWVKESKNGSKFFAGNLTLNGVDYDIVIFKNNNIKSERSPGYTGQIKDKNATVNREVDNRKFDNPFKQDSLFQNQSKAPSYGQENMTLDIQDDDDMPF